MTMPKLPFSIAFLAALAVAFAPAWVGAVEEPVYDYQSPSLFSFWLWGAVLVGSLIGVIVFYYRHKKFLAYDHILPFPAALLAAYLIFFAPLWANEHFHGWFAEQCFSFKFPVVGENRQPVEDWPAEIRSRPAECVEARENVEALLIKQAIKAYKISILDEGSKLKTGEVLFFYVLLGISWTLVLTWLWMFLCRKLIFKI